jgi:hemerythrin superfamily protein
MLATEVLVAHHDLLRDLLRRLEETSPRSPTERRRLLGALMTELTVHDRIEDEIFYPAMREVSTQVLIAHAEHRQMIDQLAVVLRTDPSSDRFQEELRVLAARLEHHAGTEEEDRMFPEAERKVDAEELRRLGEQLTERLDHLRRCRSLRLRLRLRQELLRRL